MDRVSNLGEPPLEIIEARRLGHVLAASGLLPRPDARALNETWPPDVSAAATFFAGRAATDA